MKFSNTFLFIFALTFSTLISFSHHRVDGLLNHAASISIQDVAQEEEEIDDGPSDDILKADSEEVMASN